MVVRRRGLLLLLLLLKRGALMTLSLQLNSPSLLLLKQAQLWMGVLRICGGGGVWRGLTVAAAAAVGGVKEKEEEEEGGG